MKQGAERLHQWVEAKAKGKKVYIVNTHIHKDHTAGNHLYNHPTVIAGDYGVQFWNAVNAKEDMPNVWLSDSLTMKFGDETVLIENIGQAHTFDDVIVFLKKHQTLFTGDVVLNKYHPYLDEHVGSSVDNYIVAQTKMLQQFPDVTVIPGHGEIGEAQLIFDFRQYMIDMKSAASNPDEEDKMRDKYSDYSSIPINKAGFDQTLQYIRKSETLRM
jgi:glyoxylase-like metal-dependent hydrolase (beta-lactamase superfamily II)